MFKWKRRIFPKFRWLKDIKLSERDVEQLGEAVTEVVGESTKARIARGMIIALIAAYASSPDESKASPATVQIVRTWK